MTQLEMIDELMKRAPVKSITWDSVTAEPQIAQVEFYQVDPMQELLKKAAAAGDTTLADVVKDLISAQERGE